MHLTEDYRLRPGEVAKTMLARAGEWDGTHLRTPTADGERALFSLRREGERLSLDGPLGYHEMSEHTLQNIEPDPLWESAESICRHMDEDHSDTYSVFLKAVGWKGDTSDPMTMSWVEQRGFFLSGPDCLAWIPFPQACSTPNEVRKTLIKMLKEMRCD